MQSPAAVNFAVKSAVVAALSAMALTVSFACFAQGAPPAGGPPGGGGMGGGMGAGPPGGAGMGGGMGAVAAVSGPPAQAPAKVHDLVGVWYKIRSTENDDPDIKPVEGTGSPPVPAKGVIPLKPEIEAKRAELARMNSAGEVIPGRGTKCIPYGMPHMMVFNFNVWATAEYLVAFGGYGTLRQIWLNRTEHTPEEKLFPTYQGESIGRWEGDTLVIDTIGLDPGNEIVYGLSLEDPNMHIIERWRLLNPSELEVVTTVESNKSLTKPWTYTSVYSRRASSEVINNMTYCDQPLNSSGSLDLTPPSGGYIPPGADR